MFWKSLIAVLVSAAPSILIALGFGIITYEAINAAFTALTGYLTTNMNNIATDVYKILLIGGFPDAITYLLTALSIRFSVQTMAKIGFIKK